MNPYVDDGDVRLYVGEARVVLAELPERSVHAVLTSPPFFALRDYGTGEWEGGDPACQHERPTTTMNAGFNERWGQGGGEKRQERKSGGQYAGACPDCGAVRVDHQIGLERTPEEWTTALVEVFSACRRVLRDDGTLWIEVGDSYSAGSRGDWPGDGQRPQTKDAVRSQVTQTKGGTARSYPSRPVTDVPAKNLYGMPWRLAFALQDDGWILRGAYVWEKPDAMPESVRDRCTTSHSHVFQFSKRPRYFFDRDAIREPFSETAHSHGTAVLKKQMEPGSGGRNNASFVEGIRDHDVGYAARRVPQVETLDGTEGESPRGPDGRRVLHVEATHNSEQHRSGDRWPSLEGRSPRSVWRITTEANSFGLCPACRRYWPEKAPQKHCGVDVVAHFAVWPHKLVERIVACATSEAGVCRDCGAPRVRQTTEELVVSSRPNRGRPAKRDDGDDGDHGAWGSGETVVGSYDVTTTGWEPTCECAAPTVPATVLDPFGGSGTTARQARALGRACILVELSPDYAEIAAHRLNQLALPLAADA